MSHGMSHMVSHMIGVIVWCDLYQLGYRLIGQLAHDQKLFSQEDAAAAKAAERRSHLQTCNYNMRMQSTLLITLVLQVATARGLIKEQVAGALKSTDSRFFKS